MDANGQAESVFRQQPTPGISILKGLGIIDFNGHFSVRLDDGRILINTGNSVRSAIGPEDFVVVGPKGELSEDAPRPPAELPLHLVDLSGASGCPGSRSRSCALIHSVIERRAGLRSHDGTGRAAK